MVEQKYNADAPGTPTELACKSLNQGTIETLLREKFDNMYLYAHYDIFAQNDTHSHVYTGEQVPFGQITKNALERKLPQIDLVISAIKVIKIHHPKGYNSGQVMGNLIFRDKITGKFHGLNNWTNLKYEDVLCDFSHESAFLNTIFSKLRQTAKVKSDDKLLQTVLFHEIYAALSKARVLSR